MVEEKKAKYEVSSPGAFEYKTHRLQYGLLGFLFGSRDIAPTNIAGILLCVLVIPGVILIFTQETFTKEYWETISPFVGMVLGYLFGRKTT